MNHINPKVLLGLGIAAAIAISAAVALSSFRKPVSENNEAIVYALPELHGHANEVKAIQFQVAEDKTAVTVVNSDKGWTVQQKANYPANFGKLRELLLSLADARLLEQKTTNEQRYNDLAVEDIKNKDAKGLLVSLEGLQKPVQLIIGNTSPHGDGVFVRRAGDMQSWLASGRIVVDREPAHWLDIALLDIATGRIAEIVLEKPGGNSLRLFKQQVGDNIFQLAGLPAGREVLEPAVNGLASTLVGLNLEDVSPSQTLPVPDDSRLMKAHYRLFDGLNINITAWQDDGKHYARFEALLDKVQAEASIQLELSKTKSDFETRQKNLAEQADKQASKPAKDDVKPPLAVSDPEGFRRQRLDELTKEVESINRRIQGWSYVIAAYKYANFDKSLTDLLKPLPEAKPVENKPAETKSASKKPLK